jgi:hypothetical protein
MPSQESLNGKDTKKGNEQRGTHFRKGGEDQNTYMVGNI